MPEIKYNPDGTPFVETMRLGHAEVPRCQAKKRDGYQCGQPAAKGTRVCKMHGAGTRKRVERGERKDPLTVNTVFGVYAKSGKTRISEIREELERLYQQQDIENTDPDLIVVRAVLKMLLEQEDRVAQAALTLEDASKLVEGQLEALRLSPDLETIAVVAKAARDVSQAYGLLENYSRVVSDHAYRVIKAVESRATTRAKTAEAKALEKFLELSALLSSILRETLEPEQYEIVYARFKNEVMAQLQPPG